MTTLYLIVKLKSNRMQKVVLRGLNGQALLVDAHAIRSISEDEQCTSVHLIYPSYLTLTDEGKTADKTETVLCQDSEAEILQKLGLQQKKKDNTLSEILNVIGMALFGYAAKKGFLDGLLSSEVPTPDTEENGEEEEDFPTSEEDVKFTITHMETLLNKEELTSKESSDLDSLYRIFCQFKKAGWLDKASRGEEIRALITRYEQRLPPTD